MVKIKIKDLKAGEMQSFEYVYQSYYKELLRFSYRYILCDEAKDIVQDVFIKLYENRKYLSEDVNIKSYLYSATKNRCLNFHRHLKIMDMSENRIIETILGCSEIEEPEHEKYENLQECIEKLTPQQRTILQLKADGYNYRQISEKLNISQSTVNTHIIRAYKFFRKNFGTFMSMILWP